MNDWMHQLGKHFLGKGALSYLISNEDSTLSWGDEEGIKQKVDMVIFYPNHIELVELKESDSKHRRKTIFKQNERYYNLREQMNYKTEYWIYVYWKQYKIITGTLLNEPKNCQFFAVDHTGIVEFYTSIGLNPETRVSKKVDFLLRINE